MSDLSRAEEKNVQIPEAALKCSVCHDVAQLPCLLKCCKNLCCRECLRDWRQHNSKRCPTCGTVSKRRKKVIGNISWLDEALKHRDVICSSCNASLKHHALKAHVKTCRDKLMRKKYMKSKFIPYYHYRPSVGISRHWVSSISNFSAREGIWRYEYGKIALCSKEEIELRNNSHFIEKQVVGVFWILHTAHVEMRLDNTYTILKCVELTDSDYAEINQLVNNTFTTIEDHLRKTADFFARENEISAAIVGCTPKKAVEILEKMGF